MSIEKKLRECVWKALQDSRTVPYWRDVQVEYIVQALRSSPDIAVVERKEWDTIIEYVDPVIVNVKGIGEAVRILKGEADGRWDKLQKMQRDINGWHETARFAAEKIEKMQEVVDVVRELKVMPHNPSSNCKACELESNLYKMVNDLEE